jgi:hypothetical protein
MASLPCTACAATTCQSILPTVLNAKPAMLPRNQTIPVLPAHACLGFGSLLFCFKSSFLIFVHTIHTQRMHVLAYDRKLEVETSNVSCLHGHQEREMDCCWCARLKHCAKLQATVDTSRPSSVWPKCCAAPCKWQSQSSSACKQSTTFFSTLPWMESTCSSCSGKSCYCVACSLCLPCSRT